MTHHWISRIQGPQKQDKTSNTIHRLCYLFTLHCILFTFFLPDGSYIILKGDVGLCYSLGQQFLKSIYWCVVYHLKLNKLNYAIALKYKVCLPIFICSSSNPPVFCQSGVPSPFEELWVTADLLVSSSSKSFSFVIKVWPHKKFLCLVSIVILHDSYKGTGKFFWEEMSIHFFHFCTKCFDFSLKRVEYKPFSFLIYHFFYFHH